MYKIVLFIIFSFACGENSTLSGDEIINLINSNKNSTWKAGYNFPPDTTLKNLKVLSGSLGLHSDPNFKLSTKLYESDDEEIPDFFDARDQWPNCISVLNNIRDQGKCGSCWAVSTVAMLTDRICIASNGDTQVQLSAEDVLGCCTTCGFGCHGGYVNSAWEFFRTDGVVSGGEVNSTQGCKPYGWSTYNSGQKPTCKKECTNSKYEISYTKDKKFASKQAYTLTQVKDIQTEILKNGPVVANFIVYDDLYYYKSGVYQHVGGALSGGHAVKIIGWGTENGVPYWLVTNSWGTTWGLGGFFKMLRGYNHCGIESQILAGDVSTGSSIIAPTGLLLIIIFSVLT